MTTTCRFQPAYRVMRYYYNLFLHALGTDGDSEVDTQRDLRAERARRSFSVGASVTNVQHLYNRCEERTSVDEYISCTI